MALKIADRVKETTTTTGTGTVVLGGAATGYQTFANTIGNANTTYYTIADQSGPNWEVGLGTYYSGNASLSRDTVLASSNSSSLTNFTTGTKDVFVTLPSETVSSIYYGTTPPTPATQGLLWWSSDEGKLKVYYIDSTSAQWVDATTGTVGPAGPSLINTSTITTITGILKGDGSLVSAASAGTDYVAPSGALGTPSSGTLTNCTGLPVSTGVAGLGTGVAAALANNVGSANAVVVNGGVLGTPSSGNLTNTTVDGTNKVGYLIVPQNSQATNYTLALTDAGKHIYHALGSAAATYTIDSNANVAFTTGTAVTFVNMSANNVTISITSDTMYLAGTGTTGNRTLAQYGAATALKMTSTTWIISGSGLT